MEQLSVNNCLVKGYQTILKHLQIMKVLVNNDLLSNKEELSLLQEIASIMEQYEALFMIMTIATPQMSEAITSSDIEHFLSVHFGETTPEEFNYILSLFN